MDNLNKVIDFKGHYNRFTKRDRELLSLSYVLIDDPVTYVTKERLNKLQAKLDLYDINFKVLV